MKRKSETFALYISFTLAFFLLSCRRIYSCSYHFENKIYKHAKHIYAQALFIALFASFRWFSLVFVCARRSRTLFSACVFFSSAPSCRTLRCLCIVGCSSNESHWLLTLVVSWMCDVSSKNAKNGKKVFLCALRKKIRKSIFFLNSINN